MWEERERESALEGETIAVRLAIGDFLGAGCIVQRINGACRKCQCLLLKAQNGCAGALRQILRRRSCNLKAKLMYRALAHPIAGVP